MSPSPSVRSAPLRRVGLTVALGLFLAAVASLAPPVAAVTISSPAVAGGAAVVTIHFEDPDNVPATQLEMHFSCSASGDFTDTFALEEGARTAHAVLHVFANGTTQGYGPFQGAQTGYGYFAGEHGYATGGRAVAGGYGYGYGYAGGDLALTFDLIPSGFQADETCTPRRSSPARSARSSSAWTHPASSATSSPRRACPSRHVSAPRPTPAPTRPSAAVPPWAWTPAAPSTPTACRFPWPSPGSRPTAPA